MKIETCNLLENRPGRKCPVGKDGISGFTRTVEIDQAEDAGKKRWDMQDFGRKLRIRKGNGESICRQIRSMKTK